LESSQLDPLSTVTTEDIAGAEDEEINEAMDKEILAETAETKTIRNKAAPTAK